MKNQVIEVLNEEHGKKVIEYWKSRGVNTGKHVGDNTKELDHYHRFYGIIDGNFSSYSLSYAKDNNAEIITLPNEKLPEYGQEIWVWDLDPNIKVKKKFSSMGHPNENFPVKVFDKNSICGEKHRTTGFRFWAFIEEEEEENIVELSFKDISAGKGVGVPPHLIRIKE